MSFYRLLDVASDQVRLTWRGKKNRDRRITWPGLRSEPRLKPRITTEPKRRHDFGRSPYSCVFVSFVVVIWKPNDPRQAQVDDEKPRMTRIRHEWTTGDFFPARKETNIEPRINTDGTHI